MKGKGLLKASCIGYLATVLFYILIASISLVSLIDMVADQYRDIRVMELIVNGIDVLFFVAFSLVACLISIHGLKEKKGTKKSSVLLLVLTIIYPLIVVLTCRYGDSFNGVLTVLTFLASAGYIVLYLIGTNLLSSNNNEAAK